LSIVVANVATNGSRRVSMCKVLRNKSDESDYFIVSGSASSNDGVLKNLSKMGIRQTRTTSLQFHFKMTKPSHKPLLKFTTTFQKKLTRTIRLSFPVGFLSTRRIPQSK